MPRLKPTSEQQFLTVVADNLRLCCKVFGTAKIAAFMGVSSQTVYNRIRHPEDLTHLETFRVSVCTGIKSDDFAKPLILSGICTSDKGGNS